MSEAIVPVILSGGSGTRLWPVSTDVRPKQFLALASDRTMFAETLARTGDEGLFAAPLVVGGERHAALMQEELAQTGTAGGRVLLEPCARNTAPAIALAALACPADALMLVMPSDHVIADLPAFLVAVASATPAARDGALITFGIEPTGPETGFGYIKMGDAIDSAVRLVERFIEKPPVERAEAMLAEGDHVWNAGIFLMRADRYLEELGRHAPAMLEQSQKAMQGAAQDGNLIRPDPHAFADCPSDSIDYAVMEKAERVGVVPMSCGWSDLGSWDALAELGAADEGDNRLRGDVVSLDNRDCLVRAEGITVALSGVDNLIVVATPDNVLVLPRGRSQDVKKLLEALRNRPN